MGNESDSEIRIRGYQPSKKKTLMNIAKNLGYSTLTDYLKVKLSEIINTSSESLKRDYKI